MLPQNLLNYILKTRLVTRNHLEVIHGSVYVLASIEQNPLCVEKAIDNGAEYAIISRELYYKVVHNDKIIAVDNPQKTWAFIASQLYHKLPENIATVTGTSGKTSVAYMYTQATSLITGKKSLYIGTLGAIEMGENQAKIADTLTTPDILDLRRILSESESDYTCIESSSHGISQHRIDYIPFKVAGFTNLSPEHLDYHKNIENYFEAKKRLFTDYNIDNLTLNADDEFSQRLIKISSNKNVITYGKHGNLRLIDYNPGRNLKLNINGHTYDVKWTILGNHNLYNIMCVFGMLMQTGFEIDDILPIIDRLTLPEGRMQKVVKGNLEVFIDYAHKPNALEAVLQSLVEYRDADNKGQVWVVFGCGGNRDAEKRPVMGKIASSLADKVIVTDDNPRFEDPKSIRNAIINGINSEYFEIGDRQLAIEFAVKSAGKNDIILVAGKGHEKYQIIGDKIVDFCDADIVDKIRL